MKTLSKYFLIILGLFQFLACPDVVEDPYPPASPVFVEKTTPADLIEKGIGANFRNTANPNQNSIILMWHPNSEDDIAGYNIYRAIETLDTLAQFENILSIDLSSTLPGQDTFYVDTEVSTRKRYLYYIESEDLSGNNSQPSDTISYKLLTKPHPFSIPEGTTTQNLVFHWEEEQSMADYPQNSVIRINNEANETVWVCMFQYPFNDYSFNFAPNGSNVNEENVIAFNGISGYLSPGRYFWKVEALRMGNGITTDPDIDIAGCESEWVEFILEE